MDVARRISAVLDGTAQTAMASEVLAGKQDTRISGAMDYRGMWSWNMMGAASYTHLNTPNSSIGDSDFDGRQCLPFVGAPCASPSSQWDEMYTAARSAHSGGVRVAFADGHVSFYAETIDQEIWWALGTFANGEAIPGSEI